MASDYPYMISNNKIGPILDKILTAAKPPKFSVQFLKQLGFNSSNDRAVIPLLRRLGFLSENGVPTEYYDDLKDKTKREYVLGNRIRDLYEELYMLNTEMHNAPDDEIKGAMSRVTGKDAASVNRYFATFKALVSSAKFETLKSKPVKTNLKQEEFEKPEKPSPIHIPENKSAQFHYNIQIHLPATSDISVYNAIFKSLRENLPI